MHASPARDSRADTSRCRQAIPHASRTPRRLARPAGTPTREGLFTQTRLTNITYQRSQDGTPAASSSLGAERDRSGLLVVKPDRHLFCSALLGDGDQLCALGVGSRVDASGKIEISVETEDFPLDPEDVAQIAAENGSVDAGIGC